jgi:hypothetical protein
MQDTENTSPRLVDPAWREVAARVVASQGLARSPRLRSLFLYLCEQTWAGSVEDLHESTIGQEVFSRPSGYDTASENIVRVSVSQLRKRLSDYFEGDGANEPVVISIPRGRYTLEFSSVKSSVPECEPAPANHEQSQSAGFWRRPYFWAAVGALALLIYVLVSAPWEPDVTVQTLSPRERFWSAVFTPGNDTYIVVADSGFGLLQDVTGQSFTLEQYFSRNFSAIGQSRTAAQSEELAQRLVRRQYTSVADASIAFQLGGLSRNSGGRAAVRGARSISILDLKTHNIILLGSARSNPWVGLLKDKLNFFLEYEGEPPHGIVRNKKPLSGEPVAYRATARASEPGDAYGLVAWLPNFDSTGGIVAISGTNMEGTEAAAGVLLNSKLFDELNRRLAAPANSPFPYFEAVIRTSSRVGSGTGVELIALRKLTTK